MRKLLLLPVTLPLSVARGAIVGAVQAIGDALRDASAPPSPSDAGGWVAPPTAARAPASRPADANGDGEEAPVTPLRPRPAPPPPPPEPTPAPPPAAAGEQPYAPGAEPITETEAFAPPPPEPTPGEAARAREARRESEATDDSPGAEVHVDEPWPGYGKLKAPDIVDRLGAADPATKAIVRLYESRHRKRRTVLAATDG
jgi:hypothetical protein